MRGIIINVYFTVTSELTSKEQKQKQKGQIIGGAAPAPATCPAAKILVPPPGGGGGGTQIWFRRGCAADWAAKPVPIFKGHFGGKGYPLLGVFIQENDVLCTLATKWRK